GGGVPVPGIVLLELNAHVTSLLALEFMVRPIMSFLNSGCPVLFQPFDSMDSDVLYSALRPALTEEFADRLKILPLALGSANRVAKDYQSESQKTAKSQSPGFMHTIETTRKKYPDKP